MATSARASWCPRCCLKPPERPRGSASSWIACTCIPHLQEPKGPNSDPQHLRLSPTMGLSLTWGSHIFSHKILAGKIGPQQNIYIYIYIYIYIFAWLVENKGTPKKAKNKNNRRASSGEEIRFISAGPDFLGPRLVERSQEVFCCSFFLFF